MFDNSDLINYTEIRTCVRIVLIDGRRIKKMTENQTELLRLILENDNPEQAVLTVAAIISDLLKQHESDQEQVVEYQQALCQTSPTLL